MTTDQDIWERRSNLTGVTLTVATLAWPPFTMYDLDEESGTIKNSTGIFVDIMHVLSHAMGFAYVEVLPPDNLWGGLNQVKKCTLSPTNIQWLAMRQADNTWSGMVGMLVRGEVDLCTAGLTITYERDFVIDFSVGLYEDLLTLSVVKPDGRMIDFAAYLDIFTFPSWAAIILFVLRRVPNCSKPMATLPTAASPLPSPPSPR